MSTLICWKCHFVVTNLGFLKRKKKTGPCDRCLDKMSTMQMLHENQIWIKYITPKDKNIN